MKTVTIQVKHVYGNYRIYPVCDNAITLIRLTGKQTLSLNDLLNAQALGFEIKNIDGTPFNFSV